MLRRLVMISSKIASHSQAKYIINRLSRIFSLQRATEVGKELPPRVAKEVTQRFENIRALFAKVAPDVSGKNAWRYFYQLSPGIQEYVEARTFEHYLRKQELITPEDLQRGVENVMVCDEDYILGVFDMTGEVMKFAVKNISTAATLKQQDQQQGQEHQAPSLPPSAAAIVVDVRCLRALLEEMAIPSSHGLRFQFQKKLEVTRTSVEKIERAAYGVLVRGSERPTGWVPEIESH